jgi:tellurite resistance protein
MLAWCRRMPPNTFSIAFGISGLAAMWKAMDSVVGSVRPVVALLTVIASAVWVFLLAAYVVKCLQRHALRRDLDDPVLGPFVSVVFISGLMLGMLWFWLGVESARTLVVVSALGALVLGGWLTGHWISQPLQIDDMHPGYFLPTVAGGLIAATALESVGYHDLAMMAFGIGLICWIVLGSVLLQRLFFRPMLPPPLIPLLAIELAPPAVAGNAWVALNPQTDAVQYGLGAYTLLMALVQVRLIPQYRQAPFGAAYWAFTFSYAAAATYAMHWVHLSPFPGGTPVAWVLAVFITALVVVIAVRTVVSIRAGTYFPRAAHPVAS